jgi:hypothetical protein
MRGTKQNNVDTSSKRECNKDNNNPKQILQLVMMTNSVGVNVPATEACVSGDHNEHFTEHFA